MLYPPGAAPMSAALSSPAPRRALAAVCVAFWPRCSWRSRWTGRSMAAAPSSSRRSPTSPPRWWSSASASGTTIRVSYDPYWSVAPIPITAYWASGMPSGPGVRAIVVCVLVAVWGVRLTANWVARWRGLADEDFRYAEIRARTGRLYWPASLVAIHLLPTAWVFLGLLAAWPALVGDGRPPGLLDAVALAVTAGGIAVEAVADRQLRRFLRSRRDPSERAPDRALAPFPAPQLLRGDHLLVGPLAVRPRRGPGPGVDRGRSPLHHPALHAGEQPVDGLADALSAIRCGRSGCRPRPSSRGPVAADRRPASHARGARVASPRSRRRAPRGDDGPWESSR